ncbi:MULTISPECIES: helix-turn-helix transcriptional regulator [unclassified Streptomyces]|uniref:helix-turn-helix domain-containing protein n=1 Tax=unclassified Streptomyces TaxID=2593676 RepID=UPI0033CC1EC2
MQYGPAVRRRRLGAELRTLRAAAGLTSSQAAAEVGWHQSKVSRIETGRSGVRAGDVRLLLEAYEVADRRLCELLVALAGTDDQGTAGRHHWWRAYRDLLPATYRDFISLEAQAGWVRTLETSVVPGLLQTPAYARAVTRAALGKLPEPQVDALVEVRLARQEVLRAQPPLRLSAIVDEAVLRRPVGGPLVFAQQLARLREVALLPQVRLQVLPFGRGEHAGLIGPFVILSFPSIADLDVVVLDHLTSSLYLEGKDDLQAYTEAFNSLQEQALSPEDSKEFIAGLSDGA